LLENLDRIVAGEKLKDDSGLDKDTKAALELSREMTSWTKSPSKEFKADLKARVVHQLAEEKKREVAKDPFFRIPGCYNDDRPGNSHLGLSARPLLPG